MSYQRFYEEKRYCLYCGKDISDRQLSAKICDNPECEKMRQHEKYLENKNGKNKKGNIGRHLITIFSFKKIEIKISLKKLKKQIAVKKSILLFFFIKLSAFP